ncbi:UDP-glycosyltransferase 73B3 [Linum grandiflorum]
MSDAQLLEIAAAVEASGHGFIWVVKKQEGLPQGFENGWNSIMEGVTAGVPMVTWPIQAEQFLNEKLVTDVLKVGVGVGAQEWSRNQRRILLGREEIEKAVREVMMVGEDAKDTRMKAAQLKEFARRANDKGGSSHSNLHSLLEELRSLKRQDGRWCQEKVT